MHRHGYQGRKFHRERGPRRALLKGLADVVVRDEAIETTLPKAKEVVPYLERLITKAKKGDLHNRRQVISGLATLEGAHKLVDQIAPKLGARTSGHLRVEKTRLRRGDNTQMARISFVDDLKEAPVAKAAQAAASSDKSQETSKSIPRPAAKKAPAKPAAKKPAAKETK